MLFWKYIFKLLKENVQKVSRPICYCGLIVTYLQVYHEKSQIQVSLLSPGLLDLQERVIYYQNMFSYLCSNLHWELVNRLEKVGGSL